MVTEKEFESILLYGKQFQLDMQTECTYEHWKSVNKKSKKSLEYSEEFEEWWNTFPASAKFEYRGQLFKGTRALRDKKEEAYPLYIEACKNYTAGQLLNALKCELADRKEESFNKSDNKLMYMKATSAYLRSKRYEIWIDEQLPESRENITDYNGLDI
jgi:hypothetical protein